MWVQWLLLCVLYQTIVTISFGAVQPMMDSIETTETIKMIPMLPPTIKELASIEPKSKEAILDYLKSKYLRIEEPLLNVDENASQAIITLPSKVVPTSISEVQPIEEPYSSTATMKSRVSMSPSVSPYITNVRPNQNIEIKNSPYLSNKLTTFPNPMFPIVPFSYETFISNMLPLPSISFLPIISLESLPGGSNSPNYLTYFSTFNPLFNNKKYFSSYPSIDSYGTPYPLQFTQLCLPDVLTPLEIISSNFNNNSQMFMQTPYSLDLSPQTPKEIPNFFVTNNVPRIPSLPSISVNRWRETQPSYYWSTPTPSMKFEPFDKRVVINTIPPLPYVRNIDTIHSSSSVNLVNSYYPPIAPVASLVSLPRPIVPEFNPFGVSIPRISSNPLLFNNLNSDNDFTTNIYYPDISLDINYLKDTSDCNSFNIKLKPEVPNEIPSFIPIREVSIETTVPDISHVPFPLVPTTYLNTSPTYTLSKISSDAISTLNNVVSNTVQSILTSFVPYFTSAAIKDKTPVSKVSSNLNSISTLKYTLANPLQSINLCNTQWTMPSTSQFSYTLAAIPENIQNTTAYTPKELLINPLTTTSSLHIDLTPTYFDDNLPTSVNLDSNDVSSTPETMSLPPLKVTLLPATSFIDYFPLQPCPTNLPLTNLPAYLDSSTHLKPKSQLVVNKPSIKILKTVERLLELIFLSKLVNGEKYIDWDALDAVLAILYAS